MSDLNPKRHLAALTLVVPDYDEAICWYVDILGFQLIEDKNLGAQKRWVLLSAGSGSHLLLAKADGPKQQSSIGNQTGGRVFLFLETDDFWRDYKLYKSKGVFFEEGPRTEPYGIVAVFKDLFGNRWDLIQRR